MEGFHFNPKRNIYCHDICWLHIGYIFAFCMLNLWGLCFFLVFTVIWMIFSVFQVKYDEVDCVAVCVSTCYLSVI